MNLRALEASLHRHRDRVVRCILPDGDPIPAHFHVTEVGHVVRNFIDCGGTIRSRESCLLQAWVPDGDRDHRLTAGKLEKILDLSRKVVPSDDLEVEVEYDGGVVAHYAVDTLAARDDTLTLTLANQQTDCLARERCGAETAPAAKACCGGHGCGCA